MFSNSLRFVGSDGAVVDRGSIGKACRRTRKVMEANKVLVIAGWSRALVLAVFRGAVTTVAVVSIMTAGATKWAAPLTGMAMTLINLVRVGGTRMFSGDCIWKRRCRSFGMQPRWVGSFVHCIKVLDSLGVCVSHAAHLIKQVFLQNHHCYEQEAKSHCDGVLCKKTCHDHGGNGWRKRHCLKHCKC